MALTPLQVRQVCTAGTYCRYLETTWGKGKSVSCCMKLAPQYYAEYLKQHRHIDPAKLGDNCKGYLYLKHKKQGIDVPGS